MGALVRMTLTTSDSLYYTAMKILPLNYIDYTVPHLNFKKLNDWLTNKIYIFRISLKLIFDILVHIVFAKTKNKANPASMLRSIYSFLFVASIKHILS